MQAAPLALTLSLATLLVAGVVPTAVAICGDGTLDGVEACDDGNTDAGDCCSASCEFEAEATVCDHQEFCHPVGVCDGLGACGVPDRQAFAQSALFHGCFRVGVGYSVKLHDKAGTARDKLVWKTLFSRTRWSIDDPVQAFGDPRADTRYALCIYDESVEPHEIISMIEAPVGADWDMTDEGFRLRSQGASGSNGGAMKIRLGSKRSFSVTGALAALPGPVGPDRYFDSVSMALIGENEYCEWKHFGDKTNTATKFKAKVRFFRD